MTDAVLKLWPELPKANRAGTVAIVKAASLLREKDEVRPWDWTNWGLPLWYGDNLGLTTTNGRNSCSRGCKPCVIGNEDALEARYPNQSGRVQECVGVSDEWH